jgi:uncharacterized protein YndB with AHSA1/START domain
MTVISSSTDAERLTLDLVAEFHASAEQVWDVWENPRKLERWWGPPGWPATYTRHDFEVGGQSRYYMTSPEGEKHYGWLRFDAIEGPRRFEFANGFSGQDGEPSPGVEPAGGLVEIESSAGRTRMLVQTRFIDVAQMEKMIGMGMQQGMEMALGQVDALLHEPVAA